MAGGRMKVAGAIAVGYLLGRTHKMGLTLGVTGWVIRRLASPQVVRSLVTGPITTRANRLANALSQRTAVLEQARAGAGAAHKAASQVATAAGGQPQGEAAGARPEQGGRPPATGRIAARANRLADTLSQRTAVLEQARAGAGAVEQAASQATTASGGQRQGEEPQSAQPGGEGPQGEAAAVQPEQGGRGPRRPESAGRQVEDTRRPTAR